MRTLVASAVLLLALVPLAPADASTTHTVTAVDFQWTPASITIAPGDSVEFVIGEGFHAWGRADGSDACDLPCTRTFVEEEVVSFVCTIHRSMTGEIRVGAPPAVAIATPGDGDTVQGVLLVTGTSTGAASLTVRLGAGPAQAATLEPDGTWRVEVDTNAAPNGAGTLTARAVSAIGIASERTIGIEVSNPEFVDLNVVSLQADDDATTTNTLVFKVRNEGNVAASALLVRAEYLHDGEWRLIGERTISTLAAGRTVESAIAWKPERLHLGQFDVRVLADPEHALGDVDPSDDARVASAAWVSAALPGIVAPAP